MTNLIELIDEKLVEYGFQVISDKVNNKEKCCKYINEILGEYGNKIEFSSNEIRDIFDYRVKHVLFSFGLGVVLASFCGLKEKIDAEYRKYGVDNAFMYTWLTACLYHDYGYFVGKDYSDVDDLENISLKYSIFSFDYCKSRYSGELYRAYYNWRYSEQINPAKISDENEREEVGDHGILGGMVIFSGLCDAKEQESSPKPLYQDICYRIMEHNIWRRSDVVDTTDPFHEIDAVRFKRIGISESLLYLLSLVDTIEMTKKFCRYRDNSSKGKERSAYPKTLGRKVNIEVTIESITIDFNEFNEHIKKNNYDNEIGGWKSGVKGMGEWVCVEVSDISDTKITIRKI